jgi:hypothetical protein
MWSTRFAGATLLAIAITVTGLDRAACPGQSNGSYVTVDGWAVHGYAKGVEIGYGWYKTRGEAEAEKAAMEKIETTNGKYYDKVIITPERRTILVDAANGADKKKKGESSEDLSKYLKDAWKAKKDTDEKLNSLKEAKEAVDKAKKIANGDASFFEASERKLGDTIKEYKEMLKKSWNQAMEAKKTLTSGVGGLTDAKFKQVNGLIDRYNSQLNQFQSTMGPKFSTGFAPLGRVSAPPPAPVPTNTQVALSGSSFAGHEDLAGYSRLRFVLHKGGSATMFDTDGSTSGSWSQSGDQVTLRFYNDTVVYRGTLRGKTLGGSASNPQRTWSWSLTLE